MNGSNIYSPSFFQQTQEIICNVEVLNSELWGEGALLLQGHQLANFEPFAVLIPRLFKT